MNVILDKVRVRLDSVFRYTSSIGIAYKCTAILICENKGKNKPIPEENTRSRSIYTFGGGVKTNETFVFLLAKILDQSLLFSPRSLTPQLARPLKDDIS